MADSDNGDYLSDGAEEIAATMEAQEKDVISMHDDGSFSRSPSPTSLGEISRPSSVTTGRKVTDELVAGAQAISSDEGSDVEDGEIAHSSTSPKISGEPKRTEPRDDLEDGEIESDSDEEMEEKAEAPSSAPVPLFRNNVFRPNNRPKVDFPRQQNFQQNNKRKRPEDCGVCKFYLRGNCTWNDKCKYNHPTGDQRLHWLAQLGLPDPEVGYNPNRQRRNDGSKSISPREKRNSNTFSRRHNGEKTESKQSPRACPISSDSSRSPSPKRRAQSPTAISVSSDGSKPPSRARSPLSPSPKRGRLVSASSDTSRSRSTSPFKSKTADTTLGALLRKRRLESQSKTSQDSQPSSFLPGNLSDSDDEPPAAAPPTRAEAVRRFFNRDPNDEPEIYKKKSSKLNLSSQSPTPQSITSSEDEGDHAVFESPPRRKGSESPIVASAISP